MDMQEMMNGMAATAPVGVARQWAAGHGVIDVQKSTEVDFDVRTLQWLMSRKTDAKTMAAIAVRLVNREGLEWLYRNETRKTVLEAAMENRHMPKEVLEAEDIPKAVHRLRLEGHRRSALRKQQRAAVSVRSALLEGDAFTSESTFMKVRERVLDFAGVSPEDAAKVILHREFSAELCPNIDDGTIDVLLAQEDPNLSVISWLIGECISNNIAPTEISAWTARLVKFYRACNEAPQKVKSMPYIHYCNYGMISAVRAAIRQLMDEEWAPTEKSLPLAEHFHRADSVSALAEKLLDQGTRSSVLFVAELMTCATVTAHVLADPWTDKFVDEVHKHGLTRQMVPAMRYWSGLLDMRYSTRSNCVNHRLYDLHVEGIFAAGKSPRPDYRNPLPVEYRARILLHITPAHDGGGDDMEATSFLFTEKFGDDPERWQLALSMLTDWEDSFADLISTVEALS